MTGYTSKEEHDQMKKQAFITGWTSWQLPKPGQMIPLPKGVSPNEMTEKIRATQERLAAEVFNNAFTGTEKSEKEKTPEPVTNPTLQEVIDQEVAKLVGGNPRKEQEVEVYDDDITSTTTTNAKGVGWTYLKGATSKDNVVFSYLTDDHSWFLSDKKKWRLTK